jgi:hypothetical protein
MTTITTYAELKTNIGDHLKRTDAASKYDLFIDLAEEDINSDILVREMEVRATASTSTTDRFLALPDGFIKMRRFQITVDSVEYILEPSNVKLMYIHDSAAVPSKYAITSQIEFNRTSDQAYTVTMQYIKGLTSTDHSDNLTKLSSASTTNNILTNYPTLYLSACLKHAFRWAKQYDEADYWSGMYGRQVAKINNKSRKGRYGPAPSIKISGGMVV